MRVSFVGHLLEVREPARAAQASACRDGIVVVERLSTAPLHTARGCRIRPWSVVLGTRGPRRASAACPRGRRSRSSESSSGVLLSRHWASAALERQVKNLDFTTGGGCAILRS